MIWIFFTLARERPTIKSQEQKKKKILKIVRGKSMSKQTSKTPIKNLNKVMTWLNKIDQTFAKQK